MGNRKILLPISMFLSALSALAGLLPFILIWLIVRELLSTGGTLVSGNVITYAWWATRAGCCRRIALFHGTDGVPSGRFPGRVQPASGSHAPDRRDAFGLLRLSYQWAHPQGYR